MTDSMRPAANPENGPNRLFLERVRLTPARPAPSKSVSPSQKVQAKMAEMRTEIETIKNYALDSPPVQNARPTEEEQRARLVDDLAVELEQEIKRQHSEFDENHGHQAAS